MTVPNGTSARGLGDFTVSRFPQLVQRDVGMGSDSDAPITSPTQVCAAGPTQ